MDGESVKRIVDLHCCKQTGRSQVNCASNASNHTCNPCLNRAAGCTDGYKAHNDTIAKRTHSDLFVYDAAKHKNYKSCGRCGDRRVHCHDSSLEAVLNPVFEPSCHGKIGTTIEAIPSKPENKGSQGHQHMAVRGEIPFVGLWLSIGGVVCREATITALHNHRTHKRCNTTRQVDDATAREIKGSRAAARVTMQPASAPLPGNRNWEDHCR
mmetsp:Transcript_95435/g.189156  ORF Transcript_95435/g.189156 Transcript_95435/m.189156 type:complete len:211 (+) Transcript_95435:802-1434(+)